MRNSCFHELSQQSSLGWSYELWHQKNKSTHGSLKIWQHDKLSNHKDINEHFLRVVDIINYILSFPAGETRNLLLEKANVEYTARAAANIFPLHQVIHLAEQELKGTTGFTRKYIGSPPGFSEYSSPLPGKRLIGLFAAPFNKRPNNADNSIRRLRAEANKKTSIEVEHETDELTAHQRWMFEPISDIGKDITELMLNLSFGHPGVFYVDDNLDSLFINLVNKLSTTGFSEAELTQFFNMQLRETYEGRGDLSNGTFIAYISHNEACLEKFIEKIILPWSEKGTSETFDLLASCVFWNPNLDSRSINDAFKKVLSVSDDSENISKDISSAILNKLREENGSQTITVEQIKNCLKKLPATLRSDVLKDILTNEENPVTQLISSLLNRATINQWMAECLSYDSQIPNKVYNANIVIDLSTKDSDWHTRIIKGAISQLLSGLYFSFKGILKDCSD